MSPGTEDIFSGVFGSGTGGGDGSRSSGGGGGAGGGLGGAGSGGGTGGGNAGVSTTLLSSIYFTSVSTPLSTHIIPSFNMYPCLRPSPHCFITRLTPTSQSTIGGFGEFDLQSFFRDLDPNELTYSFDWPQFNPPSSHAHTSHSSSHSSLGPTSSNSGTGGGGGGASGGNGGPGGSEGNWLDFLSGAAPDISIGAAASSSSGPAGGGLNLSIKRERGDGEDTAEGEVVSVGM